MQVNPPPRAMGQICQWTHLSLGHHARQDQVTCALYPNQHSPLSLTTAMATSTPLCHSCLYLPQRNKQEEGSLQRSPFVYLYLRHVKFKLHSQQFNKWYVIKNGLSYCHPSALCCLPSFPRHKLMQDSLPGGLTAGGQMDLEQAVAPATLVPHTSAPS